MSKRNDRETEILNIACKVFREKGFHQTRMADIAKAAGISYGLTYHYYANKAELFDAIVEKWWSGLSELMDQKLDEQAAIRDQLGVIIDYFLDQYQRNMDLVHIFITEVSRSTPNLTPARLEPFKHWIARTEGLIAKAQSEGQLRKDIKARYLTTFFLGALETFLSTMVLNDQPLKSEAQKRRIANHLLDLFFNGARNGEQQA